MDKLPHTVAEKIPGMDTPWEELQVIKASNPDAWRQYCRKALAYVSEIRRASHLEKTSERKRQIFYEIAMGRIAVPRLVRLRIKRIWTAYQFGKMAKEVSRDLAETKRSEEKIDTAHAWEVTRNIVLRGTRQAGNPGKKYNLGVPVGSKVRVLGKKIFMRDGVKYALVGVNFRDGSGHFTGFCELSALKMLDEKPPRLKKPLPSIEIGAIEEIVEKQIEEEAQADRREPHPVIREGEKEDGKHRDKPAVIPKEAIERDRFAIPIRKVDKKDKK